MSLAPKVYAKQEDKETIFTLEKNVHGLPGKMTTIISETYNRQETSHLRVGFYPPSDLLIQNGDSLPYHQLGGLGLERLCYLLLLDQGKVPRYFGNSGQKQYGIDLLVTHGDDTIVYQCKNKASFPPYQMKTALKTLETEWLACQKLPKPTEFVLCCPLSLQERKQNEAWTELERKFRSRTGVQATFWDRN
ncbi:MAG: hypothetical protein JRE64_05540, partial [Deltaproteobacteria bacterium]|nr:hypothetical protein [Deltaproteobacteria bacterium]